MDRDGVEGAILKEFYKNVEQKNLESSNVFINWHTFMSTEETLQKFKNKLKI